VHAIFPGGCAVLAATQVEEIEGAEWKDLGMPETLWINRVKEFGPLIISIDTKGNNLIAAEQGILQREEKAGAGKDQQATQLHQVADPNRVKTASVVFTRTLRFQALP
jgi:hypothetical protein